MRHKTVADVMSTDVVAIPFDATFARAVQILAARRISGAPVIDANGALVGVVSEADLLAPQAERGGSPGRVARLRSRLVRRRPRDGSVDEVMATPPITVTPDTSVTVAAASLARHSIKRLPVVDAAGALVGVVSRRDVLTVYLRPDDELRETVRSEVLERAMWMDPASVRVTVEAGVVTLQGRVERQSMVPIIAALTASVDGVVDVVNELDAEFDDTHPPRPEPENVGILHRRTR